MARRQAQNRTFSLAERYSDMNIFFLILICFTVTEKMIDKTYNFEAICSFLKINILKKKVAKTTIVIMKIHDRNRERLNMFK